MDDVNGHQFKNGWLMYDFRVMYRKYTASLPLMGCEAVERHLEMAQPTKIDENKDRRLLPGLVARLKLDAGHVV